MSGTTLARGLLVATFAAAALQLFTSNALAAQLIGRDAQGVHLAVSAGGVALVTFTSNGQTYHVLARGAINALPPSKDSAQVKFQLDYTGGKSFFGHQVWESFSNSCGHYDGPALYGVVAACKASDGSYWALQSWQQALPDLGFAPWLVEQSSYWLRLSHWSGPLAALRIDHGWSWDHRYTQIFGTYTYGGSPVYGFGTTNLGVPTDSYGRLIYLDTYDSTYGAGWFRENSFVSNRPSGVFCYGLLPRDPTKGGYKFPPGWTRGAMRGPATGSRYRIIANGPGVTPLVSWIGQAYHTWDGSNPADVIKDIENSRTIALFGADGACTKGINNYKGEGSRRVWSKKLPSLHDSFTGVLSSQWGSPTTTGGATVATSPNGLVMTLAQGAPSTARLASASREWDIANAPAWVDLGPQGVPAGASFLLSLNSANNLSAYIGIRIGGGQLEEVHTARVEQIDTSTPYIPSSMRFLFIRRTPNKTEVYYAGAVKGPWTFLGASTAKLSVYPRYSQLRLTATGDGSAAARITVVSLSQ